MPSWADGSPEAILRFLSESFWGVLERIKAIQAIREVLNYPSIWDIETLIGLENDKWLWIRQAYDSFDFLLRSYELKDSAQRTFECLKRNWLDDKLMEKAEKAVT